MSVLLYTGLLAGVETISMTSLTEYSKNKNILYLLLGIFIYGIIIPFLIVFSLKFEGIGTVNFLWNIITTVSMIMIGHYIFGDTMNYLHLISAFLGILSMIILFMANKKKK